jgi:enediyne biosynthesis protein E4
MNNTMFRSWTSRCYTIFCVGLLLAGTGEAQTFFERVNQEMATKYSYSRSVAWGDYDNDGWPDIFLSNSDQKGSGGKGRITLLHNAEGQFIDHTSGIHTDTSPKNRGGGAIFGDYDNDGDLDIYVPQGMWVASLPNILLRNDRGLFVDVTEEAGLIDRAASDNAIWLDYDRDGYIDLLVGNIGGPTERNKLYRNNRDGTFSDVTEEAGLNVQMDPDRGGSNGGMAAGDYNDDGWPDLYLTVFWAPNRLFLSDGGGRFIDRTTPNVADSGAAFGVVAGDIDNDGDIDLIQISGNIEQYRSSLLLNLGEGEFLDVTEAVGLSALATQKETLGVGLADIDNDGDLDLLTGTWSHRVHLYLNNGDGTFVDQTPLLGYANQGIAAALGDYDLDGFLDLLWTGNLITPTSLYRNIGNANHWLRVELVGIESNQNGIGARLLATSSDLRQVREILGGFGYSQDELVAHFGLGEHMQVDELEIRWPSGQVDVLTDIPADQKIRIIEGQSTFHPIIPTSWESVSSDSVVLGTKANFDHIVHPARFEADATITGVTVDLSPFGGSEATPLEPMDDGTYRLTNIPLSIEGTNGFRTLSAMIDQHTALGPRWTRFSKQIAVIPNEDLKIMDEGLAADWQIEGTAGKTAIDLRQIGTVYQGDLTGAFQVEPESRNKGWTLEWKPDAPIDMMGYRGIRFAFHPGGAKGEFFDQVGIGLNEASPVSLPDNGYVDMEKQRWQIVEVSMEELNTDPPIVSIRFSGNLAGTFYLDDIRLIAATSPPLATAVIEDHKATLPQSFTLSQNYPNPFNNSTVIRFALPTTADLDLSIFNLTGQQVATLADGIRAAGTYTLHWDGRDDDDQPLASGVYLYRLRTDDGQQQETRKLLLIR